MDKTVECLQKIHKYATDNGAVVQRVEVVTHNDGRSVDFIAHLAPKPLAQDKICIGYEVEQ